MTMVPATIVMMLWYCQMRKRMAMIKATLLQQERMASQVCYNQRRGRTEIVNQLPLNHLYSQEPPKGTSLLTLLKKIEPMLSILGPIQQWLLWIAANNYIMPSITFCTSNKMILQTIQTTFWYFLRQYTLSR